MDFIEMHQENLRKREERRKAKLKRSHVTEKGSLKKQLHSAINSGKLRKETPEELVERLWSERRSILVSMQEVSYKRALVLREKVTSIESRVTIICRNRGLQHPGDPPIFL